MFRTKQQERINKLFSSLQEIVYFHCNNLKVCDNFFLENPTKIKSIYSSTMMPAYAVIDINEKGLFSFLDFSKGKYYGRILLFEGGLVEAETKNNNFSSYVQRITDDYQKLTKHTAVYYYH